MLKSAYCAQDGVRGGERRRDGDTAHNAAAAGGCGHDRDAAADADPHLHVRDFMCTTDAQGGVEPIAAAAWVAGISSA